MSERDGGPVFPLRTGELPYRPAYDGISLRDWFAGQALAGLTSSTDATAEAWKTVAPIAAELSYVLADALLKARTQGE